MVRRICLSAAVLMLVSCYEDEPKPNLGCGELPEKSWAPLCKRFDRALELVAGGHGHLPFGVRNWLCLNNGLEAIYCETPAVLREEVQGILEYARQQSADDRYRYDNRQEPPVDPDRKASWGRPLIDLSGTLIQCAQGLASIMRRAQTNPEYAATLCPGKPSAPTR
jgi:hypothetical protein